MVAFNADQVLFVRSKVCINVTDLSAGYPYGGVGLGVCDSFRFDPGIRYAEVYGDEIGRTVEVYAVTKDALCMVRIRQWSKDALAQIFPFITPSEEQDTPKIVFDGARHEAMAADAVDLWIVPDRQTELPALKIPNCVPQVEFTETSFRFSNKFFLDLSTFWVPIPTGITSSPTGSVGKATDL